MAKNFLVLGSSPSLRTFSQLTRPSQGGFFVSTYNPPITQADWDENLGSTIQASRIARNPLIMPTEEEARTPVESERANSIPVCVLYETP